MSFTSRIKIEDLINNGSILVHKDGNHGAKYPRTEEFGELGVPFLTAKLLDNSGNIDLLKAPRLAKEKAQKFTFGFVQPEDVLLSHNATVGRVAVMPQVDEPILIGTSLTHFRLDKSKILPTYLAAYFSGKDFQNQLAAVMSQTTRDQVPITSQRKLYIELPSIEIQAEIVKYLDSIDNKIRLNNKINHTLESIAQAMFKSWFIDFDPVRAKIAAKQEGNDSELAAMCAISGKSEEELQQMAEDDLAELRATAALFPDELVESELGEVPKGWEISKISKIGKVITGKTPSSKIENSFAEKGTFFITPTDIDTEVFVTNTNRYLSEYGEIAIKNSKVDEGSLCITCIGSQMGKVVITPKSAFTNQQINSILLFNSTLRNYIFLNLRQRRDEIFLIGSGGSTMPIINKSTFESLNLILPDLALIRKFDNFISPFFNNILSNSVENIELKNIRDALLPELLAGKINVSMLKDM